MTSPANAPGRTDVVVRNAGQLCEGPLWDERIGALLWVDILRGLVHRLDVATGADAIVSELGGGLAPQEPLFGRGEEAREFFGGAACKAGCGAPLDLAGFPGFQRQHVGRLPHVLMAPECDGRVREPHRFGPLTRRYRDRLPLLYCLKNILWKADQLT